MLEKIKNFRRKHEQQAEDQSYIRDINSASLYGASMQSHLILWLSLSFVLIAIIWASFAELDEVTRGSGKTTPSSHIQVIQNLEGGILASILVKEGQMVNKGQALLQLDAVRFSSSLNENKLKYYELLAATARLTAEVNNTSLIIPEEVLSIAPGIASNARQLFKSRRNELNASTKILDEQVIQREQELIELKAKAGQISRSYSLLKEEVDLSAPLVDEGAMSRVELLRIKREANDLRGQLTAAKLSMPRIKSALDEAKNKLSETKIRFQTKALEELNQAKAELDRTSESTLALEDRVTRTRVTSPVKGIIKQLKVTTIGGVIQPGMDLLEIVPLEDQLLIEAEIRPADIAFLHPGQKAMIKLTAYDFSIYGGLEAELEHISADTITNEEDGKSYYIIRLRTNRNYLEKDGVKLSIIAGMTANVDILTGKKTVLDYILKPILKARQLALRER
ncbi:MAG: HlyD family type I secretion periplasmic adaptor subunit [Cycloclasticus sp.]|nr:HlyD family type I secretion periplasmic adaptor subunit [Cycloclasticus sp.]